MSPSPKKLMSQTSLIGKYWRMSSTNNEALNQINTYVESRI